jgi:conjugal transfer pilus assembly protein TraF
MTRILHLLFALLALTAHGLVQARADASTEARYYRQGEDGWFWYERRPDPVHPEPIPPQSNKRSGPPVLSTAWMRANLEKYRDAAIDQGTPQAIRIYAFLEKLSRDRAERFAEQFVAQQQLDPLLDETARRPTANYALNVAKRNASSATDKVIRKITSVAGLWFFFRSDCPYCHAMSPVLSRTQAIYDLAVLPISMDGLPMQDGSFSQFVVDQGQGEQLNVRGTPAMYLVHATTGEKLAISQGSLAEDELLERMLQAAHSASWITEEEWASTRTFRPLDPLDPSAGDFTRVEDDPAALLELLSQQATNSHQSPATSTPLENRP